MGKYSALFQIQNVFRLVMMTRRASASQIEWVGRKLIRYKNKANIQGLLLSSNILQYSAQNDLK